MRTNLCDGFEFIGKRVEFAVEREVPHPFLIRNHLARLGPFQALRLDRCRKKTLHFSALCQDLCALPWKDLDAVPLPHLLQNAFHGPHGNTVKAFVWHVSAVGCLVVRSQPNGLSRLGRRAQ